MAKTPFAVRKRFFLSFVRQIFFPSNVPDPVFFNQSCSFQTFRAFFVHFDRFCTFCTIFRDFFLHKSTRVSAKQTKGLLHRFPPASRKRCRRRMQQPLSEWVMKLKCRSSLCSLVRSRFLGGVDEERQHSRCENDADGVCHRRVVDGSALCRLTVEQTAQALRRQHEVGGRHRAHEGRGHCGDPVVLLFP